MGDRRKMHIAVAVEAPCTTGGDLRVNGANGVARRGNAIRHHDAVESAAGLMARRLEPLHPENLVDLTNRQVESAPMSRRGAV